MISIQPVRLQALHPSPPHSWQETSTSAEGSVKGKKEGRKRVRVRGPALLEALGIHRGVDGDPAEPRLHAAAAETAQVPVGAEERLLDCVRRGIAVRNHPDDEREEHVLVAHDEVVERREVALASALQQDQVPALDGVVGDRRRAKVLHGRGSPPDGEWQTAGV